MKACDANSLASRARAEQWAHRAMLQPAEQFVWRLLRALPWSTSDDVAYAESRIVDGRGSGLLINHDDLRRRRQDVQGSCWRRFSEIVAAGILESYQNGELRLADAQLAMFRCVAACDRASATELGPRFRFLPNESPSFENTWEGSLREIVARMILEAMTTTTNHRESLQRGRRPQWLEGVALTVVNVLVDQNPDRPIALTAYQPRRANEVFGAAADWLVTLGVCAADAALRQRTLYAWYLAQPTRPRRRRGRPRGRR